MVTCTDAPVDRDGNTALHVAVEHGSLLVSKYLINECKISPNKMNGCSHTPLDIACCFGKMHIAEYLINEFPGVVTGTNAAVGKDENTALHVAAQHGHLKLVTFLAKKCKLDSNKTNRYLNTPLHIAVIHNHLPVIRFFLDERLCDPSSLNYSECLRYANRKTSSVLLAVYNVKSHFSAYGSRSDVDRYVKFLRVVKSSFPVHSFTKLLLLGDPAACW